MAPTQSKRSRKRAPSKVEWDRINKHWHQLYIREKLPLSEVSARLAREHNFEAGLSMYKTRMKQLRTRKNFKKEELAAVARILENFVCAGLKMPTAVIDGQPIPTGRVKRYFSSLFTHNTVRSSKTPNCSPERAYQRILNNFQDRNDEAKGEHPRRLSNMPRIFLKQSKDMHALELTLIQVNNYYCWRLHQSDDYFLQQMVNDGHCCADTDMLDPVELFNAIDNTIYSFGQGASHVNQASMRYIRRQAPVLLREQHPQFLEGLIYYSLTYYEGDSGRAKSRIYSYLFSLARSLLRESHPISMILKVLQSPETQQTSQLLLLNMMCDVARTQGESFSKHVLEFEYDMAEAIARREGFHAALECWHRLLQRSVVELGEKHEFCRRVLYEIGSLYYDHNLDEARKFLLQVLEQDDAYIQGSKDTNWTTVNTMYVLGRICEDERDLSRAEKWYLQAFEVTCYNCGPEHFATLVFLHEVNRVWAKLKEEENVPKIDVDCDEDVLRELQVEITRLQCQGVEESEESEKFRLRTEPWNEWDKEVPGANDSINFSKRETTEEAVTPTNEAVNEGDHQNSHRTEFAHSFDSTPPVMEPIWDIANITGSWEEHVSPAPALSSLEGLFSEGTFDGFGKDGMGFASSPLTVVDGFSNGALAAFMPREPTLAPSLPASEQNFTTASPYIVTLPALNNDPEFREFDNTGNAGDDFGGDPMVLDSGLGIDSMILDSTAVFSTFDLNLFDSADLQELYAIDTQDLRKDQDFSAL